MILLSRTAEELAAWAAENHFPKFRARQIADWLYRRFESDADKMDNLPKELRERLKQSFFTPAARFVQSAPSSDGTEKLLLELQDKECIEMVLIPGKDGRITFCLSTQVGCPVRCRFCASGQQGLIRNLDAGEILEEFRYGCCRIGRKPDNVVFMGIGEGLLNFSNLKRVLELLTGPDYFAMSPRRITVSTSGYIPGIDQLAELGKEYTLAISLHAPDDATRAKLIPDALRAKVGDIMLAAKRYEEKCGRMVTFEYTLLKGYNDSAEQAEKLAVIAKDCHAKVNLIAYNPTGSGFERPSKNVIDQFKTVLEKAGAHVTLRVEHGSKESSACGQLRLQKLHDAAMQ